MQLIAHNLIISFKPFQFIGICILHINIKIYYTTVLRKYFKIEKTNL